MITPSPNFGFNVLRVIADYARSADNSPSSMHRTNGTTVFTWPIFKRSGVEVTFYRTSAFFAEDAIGRNMPAANLARRRCHDRPVASRPAGSCSVVRGLPSDHRLHRPTVFILRIKGYCESAVDVGTRKSTGDMARGSTSFKPSQPVTESRREEKMNTRLLRKIAEIIQNKPSKFEMQFLHADKDGKCEPECTCGCRSAR